MHLNHLQLTNFRNFQEIALELNPGRLLFLGDNAQGKSNLLEAVHLLSAGKSSRASNDSEMIGLQSASDTQPFTRISADLERLNDHLHLDLVVVGGGSTGAGPTQRAGKRFRVKGIPRRAVDFVGQLHAVLFTADDLDIISGPPAPRRQFLDAALSQIDRAYYTALQRYSRVMQQRNASLRRIREGSASVDELSLWDETFTQEGATIIASRQRALLSLTETAAAAHIELAGDAAQESLQLTYQPQLGTEWSRLLEPDANSQAVKSLFAAALSGQRRREIAAGVSLAGPHRDDFGISINGVSAASFGSRAQIRTAALALRLAEARLVMAGSNDPPVLLLDDIVSELDERRRRSVLASLSGFEQVWFTAASGSWLPPDFTAECRVFDVSAGQVRTA